MRQVEAEGKTLEEALQKASQALRVPAEALKYEVLAQRRRLLGILGKESIRIRAWTEQVHRAQAFLEGLLRAAGLGCRISASREMEEGLALELEGEDQELLLRRQGRLLDALQHLTEKVLNRGTAERRRVFLDAEGFRSRREQELRQSALRAAKQALMGGSAVLGPLNARDRRIVHLALRDQPGITTRSVGEGPVRRVVISREASRNRQGVTREAT